jgi:hypothetical protein
MPQDWRSAKVGVLPIRLTGRPSVEPDSWRSFMGNSALRVCPESMQSGSTPPAAVVKLRLREVFPLLLYAHRHNFTWLRDLADDEIIVTPDLAEVIHTFEKILIDRKRA